jgi:ABC-2 type transport system ATP-binding protein
MMITLEHLTKHYKRTQALNGVSFQVAEGELFAYLGPNGAGKTTTIRILTGLTRLSSGAAYLNGYHVERQAIAAKRQCGLVPQAINLDPELTVAENLQLHGRLFGMTPRRRAQQIDALLDYVEMRDRKSSLVKQLSGGLKRRVMLARALVHSPKILFLDEPTVGLDANIRRRIWAFIKKIQRHGTTIFLTTHYIEEAEFLADRVAFLDEGRLVALDSPNTLMKRVGAWAIDRIEDNHLKAVYFDTMEDAQRYMAQQQESFTLRRVNLEDAFLALTGKKVEE